MYGIKEPLKGTNKEKNLVSVFRYFYVKESKEG